MRRQIREAVFRMIREDLLRFLDDHQEDLLRIFRQEMAQLDRSLPEEQALIDINMVALGEEMLLAILSTLRRFVHEV
jgi:hypothetical protein